MPEAPLRVQGIYATPERMRDRRRWIIFDDRGTLEVDEGVLLFQGPRRRVEIRGIEDVAFERQALNWGPGLVILAAAFGAVAAVAFGLLPATGASPAASWGTMAFAAVLALTMGTMAWIGQVFVRVEGRDPSGKAVVAYVRQDDAGFPRRRPTHAIARRLRGEA